MTTIDRYVVRAFLAGYVVFVLVGMSLIISVHMLANLDEFTEDKGLSSAAVFGNMVHFYAFNLPLYYSQLSGPALAAAGAFAFARMMASNELTALLSAGVPLQRLVAPILVASLAVIGVWLANRELLLPEIAPYVVRRPDDVNRTRTVGVYCVRDERNAIVTALRLYPAERQLYDVYIVEPDETGAPKNLIQADAATYDAAQGLWRLEGGRRLVMGAPSSIDKLAGGVEYQPVTTFKTSLTADDMVLQQASEWSELLSTPQMVQLARFRRVANRAAIVNGLHVRLTQPILQLILLMLPVPFFLSSRPGSVVAAGGFALAASGAFFVFVFLAHLMMEDQWAALIAWSPILIFGPIAVVRVASIRT